MTKKYYVNFFTPGAIVSDKWSIEVDSPDKNKIEFPDNAYAFAIFALYKTEIDGISLKSDLVQIGKLYYHPESKIETLAQLKFNPNATRILINNAKINGWDKIIWTRWGNWPQPFNPEKMEILR